VALAAASLLLAFSAAAQVEVIAVAAGGITLSAGSTDGVATERTGTVRSAEIVAGKPAVRELARFKVATVRERTSDAALTGVSPGASIACGMEVVFDVPLVRPALAAPPAAPPPAPWLPTPGRDPLFYLSRDDEELQEGRPELAEAYLRMALESFPGGATARLDRDEIAAMDRGADASVSRAHEEAEVRSRVLLRVPDAEAALKSGDALLAAGDKEGAAASWARIAAADPGYPGLRDRARSLVPAPGERRAFAPSGTEFVFVPAGTFQAGCVPGDDECAPDEKPRHAVTVSHGFWTAAKLTTLAQFREFARATARAMPPAPPFGQSDTHPVVNVTWDDAVSYCTWAGGRLPTEAEWERAARGGRDGERYPTGARIGHDDANFSGTGGRDVWESSSPVGSFGANGYGLFDMAGNAWEWCADRYDPDAWSHAPARDPKGPAEGSLRALRGGSFLYSAARLRASARDKLDAPSRSEDVGFRCVRDVPPWILAASGAGMARED